MKRLVLLLSVCFAMQANAQITVDTYAVDTMLMDFFNGTCVTISNVTTPNGTSGIGYFQNVGINELPLNAGVILTSGLPSSIPTPASVFSSTANESGSYALLDTLAASSFDQYNGPSYDAAVVEFDFTSCEADLAFWYVFGSEEYPEYANSSFNDIFGFFVSGPGFTGNENVADYISANGSSQYVSINNINATDDFNYYYDNQFGNYCAYDGLTTLMPAAFTVVPGETYHASIAIADIADQVFDSGVFLGIQSIGGDSVLVPPALFMVANDNTSNTVTFVNQSRYATSWLWNFGDGTTSTDRNPGEHTYSAAGEYIVSLTTTNFCCTDVVEKTITVGTTGNNDVQKNTIGIRPNPATDQIQLDLPGNQTGTLSILNNLGQVVISETASNQTKVNVSQLPKGMYTVRFETEGTVHVSRLVKN